MYFRKDIGLPGSSVSFRQGTNVEIGPPSFMSASGDGASGVSSVICIRTLIKFCDFCFSGPRHVITSMFVSCN